MLQIKGKSLPKPASLPRANQTVVNRKTSYHIQKTPIKPPLPSRYNSSIFFKEQCLGTIQPAQKIPSVKKLKHNYVCDQRRENILNSKYLKKKEKLFQITKQNIKIFQRINSQKSIYSYQQMNKSYESHKSLRSSRASVQSNCSKTSLKLSRNSSKGSGYGQNKNGDFFNRSNSSKRMGQQSYTKPISTCNGSRAPAIISQRNKKTSFYQINPKSIHQTHYDQDLKQFQNLFNIKQEASQKQANKAARIKSLQVTKATCLATPRSRRINNRASQPFDDCFQLNRRNKASSSNFRNPVRKSTFNQKPEVMNEQNETEILEQIEVQQSSRIKDVSKINTCSSCNHSHARHAGQKESAQCNHTKRDLNSNSRLGISKLSMNSEKGKIWDHRALSSKVLTPSNYQASLYEQLKTSSSRKNQSQYQHPHSRFATKLMDQKIASKYTNLLTKIQQEIHKVKRNPNTLPRGRPNYVKANANSKENAYPIKSRLLA